jgi:lipopolysaccharide export system protein LptA
MNRSTHHLSTLSVILCLFGLSYGAKLTHAQDTQKSQILIQADSQAVDAKTKLLTARGNVLFSDPLHRIDARADEVQYSNERQYLILKGNVRLVHRGKLMEGAQVTCQLKTGQCKL